MNQFLSFEGVVTMIEDFMVDQSGTDSGCYKLFTMENRDRTVTSFIVGPDTYFVDQVKVTVGDFITGWYDSTVAVPLIYPPRYRAVVMSRYSRRSDVKVDFFDQRLVSSDGSLKLNIGPSTVLELENGQTFLGNPGNRNLIVQYFGTTRSIPAQTTPNKIVVICGYEGA